MPKRPEEKTKKPDLGMGRIDEILGQFELKEHKGLKIKVRKNSSDTVVFEDNILKSPVLRHLTAKGTWLELGGYIGTFAAKLLHEGATEVLTVEADPLHTVLYRMNLELNGFSPNILCAAVSESDSSKIVDMIINHRGSKTKSNVAANTIIQKWKTNRPTVPVSVISWKNVLQYSKSVFGKYPDSVKFDIEGSEIEILSNNSMEMFNQLFIEYHFAANKEVSVFHDIIESLKSQGFRTHTSRTVPENGLWDWFPSTVNIWACKEKN